MSKIPQGELSAIAERYSQGESISSISRHYGCTAPAIHYILKRTKERTAVSNQRPALAQTPTNREVAQPVRISGGENGRSSSSLVARRAPTVQITVPSPNEHREEKNERDFAPLTVPARTERTPTAELQLQRDKPQRVSRASALTAGLDTELRADAEVAIQAFCSSFDAALAENVSITRERLRQAASDLMRVAARTTIVLDRLSAGTKRAV
jgi:transposase-like protein